MVRDRTYAMQSEASGTRTWSDSWGSTSGDDDAWTASARDAVKPLALGSVWLSWVEQAGTLSGVEKDLDEKIRVVYVNETGVPPRENRV